MPQQGRRQLFKRAPADPGVDTGTVGRPPGLGSPANPALDDPGSAIRMANFRRMMTGQSGTAGVRMPPVAPPPPPVGQAPGPPPPVAPMTPMPISATPPVSVPMEPPPASQDPMFTKPQTPSWMGSPANPDGGDYGIAKAQPDQGGFGLSKMDPGQDAQAAKWQPDQGFGLAKADAENPSENKAEGGVEEPYFRKTPNEMASY
jgi:hypothetical protein